MFPVDYTAVQLTISRPAVGETRNQSQGPVSVSGNGEAVFAACFLRKHVLDWALEYNLEVSLGPS